MQLPFGFVICNPLMVMLDCPLTTIGPEGINVTAWMAVLPTPERLIIWGLLVPLSVITISPLLVPVEAGVKVILMEHVAPMAK